MKSRIAAYALIVLASTSITACQQKAGISPVLNATDVQSASINTHSILYALMADTGINPADGVDWYLVSEAGFNYIDDRCRSYFDDLFFLDRQREQVKSGLSAVGQTTAAILGVTGASSVSLAVVAQAFGFGINATELIAGTYLYRLPPATTQGFVQKLQLAFRDAAAAKRLSINSPTIAYHIIQRYLDLCLPPRIEAEITKQISSTTAIPIAQGSGALFSIETVSVPSAEALQPNSFGSKLTPAPLETPPLPAVERKLRTTIPRSAKEQLPLQKQTKEQRQYAQAQSQTFFIAEVQRALCEQPNGIAGPSTQKAIQAYMQARVGTKPKEINLSSPAVRIRLEEAVTDVVDCKLGGFRNAYEVGRFGVPDSSKAKRIKQTQEALVRLLKERGIDFRVDGSGTFDEATRKAISKLREATGTTGDEIDFQLDVLLQS